MQAEERIGADAADWLARYKAAGLRMKVDGLSVSPHPDDNALEACRDMWSELRASGNADARREVEVEVRRQVEAMAAWTDWPIRE